MTGKFAHGLLLLSASVLALATAAQASDASKGYSTVYAFCQKANCADGSDPVGAVIVDANGNLYGTTETGGGGAYGGSSGGGTVFRIAPDGTETVLYAFCSLPNCSDGETPYDYKLIMDRSGNLYGTTFTGGAYSSSYCYNAGCGVVFKVAPDGTETVLHSFCSQTNCTDGAQPESGLIMDHRGNLYGTTPSGGANNDSGTVYKVAPNGTETVLYSFCAQASCTDGAWPFGGLLRDRTGNLYGTTDIGGTSNDGVVYKLAPDGTETVLYPFCSGTPAGSCTDGTNSFSTLAEDGSGNYYGTTEKGGANGQGVAFELAANGTESVLYNFCSDDQNNVCLDGNLQEYGLLSPAGRKATIYGTTVLGGSYNGGVVFSLSGGVEKVLYSFGQSTDGFANGVNSGLLKYQGYLYGAVADGGPNNGGIIFRVGTSGVGAR